MGSFFVKGEKWGVDDKRKCRCPQKRTERSFCCVFLMCYRISKMQQVLKREQKVWDLFVVGQKWGVDDKRKCRCHQKRTEEFFLLCVNLTSYCHACTSLQGNSSMCITFTEASFGDKWGCGGDRFWELSSVFADTWLHHPPDTTGQHLKLDSITHLTQKAKARSGNWIQLKGVKN